MSRSATRRTACATSRACSPTGRSAASDRICFGATDISFTGSDNNTHQVYVSRLADYRLKDADIVDHLVVLVEQKAAAIEAAKSAETAAALEPAQ
jgi:hypothetical protein